MTARDVQQLSSHKMTFFLENYGKFISSLSKNRFSIVFTIKFTFPQQILSVLQQAGTLNPLYTSYIHINRINI